MAHNGSRASHEGTPYAAPYPPQQSHTPSMSQPHPYPALNQSQQSQTPHGALQSPYKSFNDAQYNSNMRAFNQDKAQIYTAVYSGVQVYEMEVNGVACMRRRNDGWLNATQILKVAGIEKGKRTKVLEKEILTGEHEKVQGGYGKYQGTWISYHRGREFCRQYQVEDALLPLLEHDLNGDGTGTGTQNTETPTKEQAMAANRKRFYNAGLDQRNGAQTSSSTFFQNISPMSQMAISAMQKAGKINSPARPQSNLRTSSYGQNAQHDPSLLDPSQDSGYGTHSNAHRLSGQEPPRKRVRHSDAPAADVDASMMSVDATEQGDSFLYGAQSFVDSQVERDELSTDVALPSPVTAEDEEKKALLLDLFADAGQKDYTTHPAFTQLSAHDLSIPLDASANTALHWATTLSRIQLLRMLIQKGANIYRGNVAGHSALISAVLVNNCWERSSFPEVLELLSPLIEIRDHQGRTILHHIAVSCGIKGRAPSSKYYLEALLEFLVRSVKTQAAEKENSEGQDRPKQATLMSFLTNIVNAKDKLGNTALNLVARIGNRSIIQQLLEIKADPNIPNYKGVSARDFGVGVEDAEANMLQPRSSHLLNGTSASAAASFNNPSHIDPAISQSPANTAVDSSEATSLQQADAVAVTEDQNQDVISSLTTMLNQNFAQHKSLLSLKTAHIDRLNAEIRALSATQKAEADAFIALQQRSKQRSDRLVKLANLRRLVEDRRRQNGGRQQAKKIAVGEAERCVPSLAAIVHGARSLPANIAGSDDEVPPATDEVRALLASFSTSDLRALVAAYEANNAGLTHVASTLQRKSNQLEVLYRKVVALCTGVPEDSVEEALPLLVAAVESERGALGREEVGRVREFLIKVEGAVGKEGQGTEENGGSGDAGRDESRNGGLETPRLGRVSMGLQRGLMGPPELPA